MNNLSKAWSLGTDIADADAEFFSKNPDRRYRLRVNPRSVCVGDTFEWVGVGFVVHKTPDGALKRRVLTVRQPLSWEPDVWGEHQCCELEAHALWKLAPLGDDD